MSDHPSSPANFLPILIPRKFRKFRKFDPTPIPHDPSPAPPITANQPVAVRKTSSAARNDSTGSSRGRYSIPT